MRNASLDQVRTWMSPAKLSTSSRVPRVMASVVSTPGPLVSRVKSKAVTA
jgi:hypothetical protein